MRKCTERRDIPASNAFVPSAAGLIVGGEIVKDLVKRAGTLRIAPEDAADNVQAQQAEAQAQAHLQKYHQMVKAKKEGTWVDDKVVMTLESAGIK